VIQQWFLEMPDKLGKLLAEHDATLYAAGLPVKSDEERERLERRHEKEFLRSQGNYTEEVRPAVSWHSGWVAASPLIGALVSMQPCHLGRSRVELR